MTTILRRTALLAVLFGLASLAWADNSAVVGTWNCVATDGAKAKWQWTLVIADNNGTLSGTATGHAGTLPLSNMAFDGTNLTFSVATNDQSYSVQLTVTGTTMSGSYTGTDNGTVQARLQQ